MTIRDYGIGSPENKLKEFLKGGFAAGVGLAGMRERIRDLNGSLAIIGDQGTTICVRIPIPESHSSGLNIARLQIRESGKYVPPSRKAAD